MDLREYLTVLRVRWRIIATVTFVMASAAIVLSLLTTPVYLATAQLFVTTTASGTVGEAYTGSQLSQERVGSYRALITGHQVSSRVINELGLNLTPRQLSSQIAATSAPGTVLIDVSVQDTDPNQARVIANSVARNFTELAQELETTPNGGLPAARVSLVQEAETLAAPIKPTTIANLAMGIVVGLFLGVCLAVLRDRLDSTIKDRKVLEDTTRVAVLGALPFEKERSKIAAINFGDSHSLGAEAYRALRTNLQFLDVDTPPRVLVISSSLPMEGKSTTAINLALALAESGKSVVLVEGDLRRPRVTKYLGLVQGVGLTTVLAGQADLDGVLQPTSYPGLSVLGAGPIPPNPSELLGSTQSSNLIDLLRRRFDYVIIDAPPLLPVTDAAVLSNLADGAIIVARHSQTRKDEVSRSIESLTSIGVKVLGTVLTLIPTNAGGNYDYAYRYQADVDSPRQHHFRPTQSTATSLPIMRRYQPMEHELAERSRN